MPYRFLFRSRWAALFWAAWIIVGVYLRGSYLPQPAPEPAEQASTNPWAKDPG